MNPNAPQYPAPGTPPPADGPKHGGGRQAPWALRTELSLPLSDAIVGGATLLFFLFSFTSFYSNDTISVHQNLWSFDSPIGWWTAIANLLLLGSAMAARFWPNDREYIGFRRSQVQVVIGLWVFLIVFGNLIALGSNFGWGGYLMLLISLTALVSAVLGHLGRLQNVVTMPTRGGSTPGGYPPDGQQDQTVILPRSDTY